MSTGGEAFWFEGLGLGTHQIGGLGQTGLWEPPFPCEMQTQVEGGSMWGSLLLEQLAQSDHP